jgi:hypothetical protein
LFYFEVVLDAPPRATGNIHRRPYRRVPGGAELVLVDRLAAALGALI